MLDRSGAVRRAFPQSIAACRRRPICNFFHAFGSVTGMHDDQAARDPAPASPPRPFQWRAMTSVLIATSFLLLVVTGVVLFVSPPGRIANWTNWNILGLRKTDWAGLHIWFGAVFLVVALFHLAYNWRPLLSYFKDRMTRRMGFRREWAAALALCVAVFAGTRANVPPFSLLLTWNEDLKQSWDQASDRAPIPHAELLTLAELAAKGGVELATATARLEARGIRGFTADTVVQKIADQARIPARQVYEIMLMEKGGGPGAGRAGAGAGKGPGGGGGPGRKTLTQFCAEEGIDVPAALARLQAKGFKAEAGLTLREIAVNNGFQKPYELLGTIRGQ